ncbi:MAG: hypothetical protein A2284_12075 [Deltaproteobacteria bacterium RIFOXYA12_FULL_61_11]|nr:MAG: hypothetical protein A2284_12075 [Deltaproteobacteria bacterium RIFOXYA12_FULL_61_11]
MKLLLLVLLLAGARGQAGEPRLTIAVHNPTGAAIDDRGLRSLLHKAPQVCNLQVDPVPRVVDLAHRAALVDTPLLVLRGRGSFVLDQARQSNLLLFLAAGGTVFIDAPDGRYEAPFNASARALAAALFPDRELERLHKGHVLFQTYYLLDHAVGRVIERSYLEGINHSGRVALLISYNDLHGAWERDALGRHVHDVVPGRDVQRMQSFRLGVNLLLYALTLDYKADLVHIPEILKRRKLRDRGESRD